MSASNGVICIGRKGLKKFAFGEDGPPFEVEVVVAFQQWVAVDESFRPIEPDAEGNRPVPTEAMASYHQAAVAFAEEQAGGQYDGTITVAEAIEFKTKLMDAYNELADFFQPKSREKRDSPDTSEVELRFSTEPN